MTEQPNWARLRARLLVGVAMLCVVASSRSADAVTPDSPEVKAVLDKAFKFLETANDGRLGAKCLVGLTFIKRGERESHPQIKAAVDACQAFKNGNPEGKPVARDYVYRPASRWCFSAS